jgi:hypothetical protein
LSSFLIGLAFTPATKNAAATAANAIPRFMGATLQPFAAVDYPAPRS